MEECRYSWYISAIQYIKTLFKANLSCLNHWCKKVSHTFNASPALVFLYAI